MARLAVYVYHFARRVHVFGNAQCFVELVAVLIEVGDFELGAVGNTATGGIELVEKKI